jgi:hypothetical protein
LKEIPMGFITNQWLKGFLRNRTFHPVSGAVSAKAASDSWAKRNGVLLEIRLKKSDGSFQELYLTRDELNKILPTVVELGDVEPRTEAAVASLNSLDDAELLEALKSVLSKRKR